MENPELFRDGIHDDTIAVQRLLDKRGEIHLSSGVYLITRPLKIHSGTKLHLDCGAVMRLADGANCAIIENDRFDENSVLNRELPYNRGISIEGGVWDGNNANQIRWPSEKREALTSFDDHYYFGIFMRFSGVNHFSMANVTIKDPESFAVQLTDTQYFTFRDITFDFNCLRANMDGIHINGPAQFGFISNIQGRTNDDLIALNCDDGYPAEITRGPISDIRIDGVYSDCGFNAVRLLSCGNRLSNVSIRNVHGTYRFYAISFTCENLHKGEDCCIDNILLDGIFASKAAYPLPKGCFTYNGDLWAIDEQPLICFDHNSKTGQVTIQNMHRRESAATHASSVVVRNTASVERLTIRDSSLRFENGAPVPFLRADGTVNELIMSDIWKPGEK